MRLFLPLESGEDVFLSSGLPACGACPWQPRLVVRPKTVRFLRKRGRPRNLETVVDLRLAFRLRPRSHVGEALGSLGQ